MPSSTHQQLTLNVGLRDGLRFTSFYRQTQSDNSKIVDVLKNFALSSIAQQNCLWGESQSGKTHLLQACCAAKSDKQEIVSYVPLKIFANSGIDILSGLSKSQLIVLDDIDTVIGNKEWETALFNLINETRDNSQQLLISCTKNPRELNCVLPDLASRIIWGGCYQLHLLDDDEKPHAIQARAEQRGFKISDQVIRYLYRRYPRDIESLLVILDQLDEESLKQKTVITVPFVKQVLENT